MSVLLLLISKEGSYLMEDVELERALLKVIQHFIERQKLVYQAMSDLRPDFLFFEEHRHDIQDHLDEWLNLVEKYGKASDPPEFWRPHNEWMHRWHGSGCRLIHRITKEPIEWDAGDILSFDWYWLANHLAWRIGQDPHEENISIILIALEQQHLTVHDFIKVSLEQLADKGCLAREENEKHRLLLNSGCI